MNVYRLRHCIGVIRPANHTNLSIGRTHAVVIDSRIVIDGAGEVRVNATPVSPRICSVIGCFVLYRSAPDTPILVVQRIVRLIDGNVPICLRAINAINEYVALLRDAAGGSRPTSRERVRGVIASITIRLCNSKVFIVRLNELDALIVARTVINADMLSNLAFAQLIASSAVWSLAACAAMFAEPGARPVSLARAVAGKSVAASRMVTTSRRIRGHVLIFDLQGIRSAGASAAR